MIPRLIHQRSRGFARIVSNAVIASPPHHPFWTHLLALLQRCRHARDPLDATGAFVLTAAVETAAPTIAPEVLPASLAARKDRAGAPVPPHAAATQAPFADHRWAGGRRVPPPHQTIRDFLGRYVAKPPPPLPPGGNAGRPAVCVDGASKALYDPRPSGNGRRRGAASSCL